jgi:hypothetical protein
MIENKGKPEDIESLKKSSEERIRGNNTNTNTNNINSKNGRKIPDCKKSI